MVNGFLIDRLFCVGIKEIVKLVGKVLKKNEGVSYTENFKKSPFGKFFEIFFV